MSATIPLLRRDHVNFTLVLNALSRQVEVADAGHEPSISLIKLILKYFKDYPRKVHHPKEDLIYGALIRNMPDHAANVFHALQDHREMTTYLESLEESVQVFSSADPASVKNLCYQALRFIDHEHEHMRLEEGYLFPDAVHRLADEEWRLIDLEMANAKDPLFGDTVASPYECLKDAIVSLDKTLKPLQ